MKGSELLDDVARRDRCSRIAGRVRKGLVVSDRDAHSVAERTRCQGIYRDVA